MHPRRLAWNIISWRFDSDHVPFSNGWFVGEPALNLLGCIHAFLAIRNQEILQALKLGSNKISPLPCCIPWKCRSHLGFISSSDPTPKAWLYTIHFRPTFPNYTKINQVNLLVNLAFQSQPHDVCAEYMTWVHRTATIREISECPLSFVLFEFTMIQHLKSTICCFHILLKTSMIFRSFTRKFKKAVHTDGQLPLFQQVMTPANKQEVNINDSRMRFHITSETSLPHQWRGCASATRVSWQYPCWWKPLSKDVLESLKNPTFHYSFSFGGSIHLTLTCRNMKRLICSHGDASFY